QPGRRTGQQRPAHPPPGRQPRAGLYRRRAALGYRGRAGTVAGRSTPARLKSPARIPGCSAPALRLGGSGILPYRRLTSLIELVLDAPRAGLAMGFLGGSSTSSYQDWPTAIVLLIGFAH